ncbi:MAG TPA: response regulator [Spirochaetia bacterium]|nr:response regulator [Spirochaetia bacterium]
MAKKEKKVRIFSALEVADICGVVNQTAINWIKNGFLKAFMTPGGQYRVYAEDLLAFLSSRGMRVPEELLESAEDGPLWDRVLIVDDDENINTLIKRFLTRRMPSATVLQAFDGFEAGKQISDSRPGVIILDISLPGIDGHRLCRRIKEDPGLGSPIIIAITGLTDEDMEQTVTTEGADAFFRKPLDLEKLQEKIEELTAARTSRSVRNG